MGNKKRRGPSKPRPGAPSRQGWGHWEQYPVRDSLRVLHEARGASSVKQFANNVYRVFVIELPEGVTHLSIRNHDNTAAAHDWRAFQRIKSELAGGDREAFEIYPDEARVVDTSNEFHLWVLPAGEVIPFGFFGERTVLKPGEPLGEAAQEYARKHGIEDLLERTAQRPLEDDQPTVRVEVTTDDGRTAAWETSEDGTHTPVDA